MVLGCIMVDMDRRTLAPIMGIRRLRRLVDVVTELPR